MAAVEQVRAADLLVRLRRHYLKPGPMPGGIFVPEVGINGPTRQTRCDAVHVGFTSTSSRLLTGHEIKVSRSDWLHELDQPHKATFWVDNCHRWYVVAPVGVVKPDELPHGWGLMVPNPRTTTRMDIVRAALTVTIDPSWNAVRSIFARQDTLRAAEIDRAVSALSDAERERLEKVYRARATNADTPASASLRKVVEICEARKHREHIWRELTPELIAETVIDTARAREALIDARRALESTVSRVRELLDPFRGPLGALGAELERLALPPAVDPRG